MFLKPKCFRLMSLQEEDQETARAHGAPNAAYETPKVTKVTDDIVGAGGNLPQSMRLEMKALSDSSPILNSTREASHLFQAVGLNS